MAMATAQDIPLLIVSENSASERRISPSWTIAQLKGRLEPVTGVPATCQKLSLKIGSQAAQPIEAADEESTILAAWPLQAYAELKVGIAIFLSSQVVIHGALDQGVWRYHFILMIEVTATCYCKDSCSHDLDMYGGNQPMSMIKTSTCCLIPFMFNRQFSHQIPSKC
jgi:hypothetical protein